MIDHFLLDRDASSFYPLASFLQSPPTSVAEKYIAAFTEPGDLVIDPFASKPTLARVAQQMGRRAILFDNNPLWAWLARAMATLASVDEINSTFARLGDAVKDDAPIRTHILQLYATRCAECNQLTPADYFVHRRDEGPLQRHYTCDSCGATRDDPATPDDLERAKAFDPRGFHYHLGFERVVPAENLHAERIRKMLDLYTPRNLYAIVTMTTKSDLLFVEPSERQIITLLLLHLLDRGTKLYADAAKPAQLSRHKQFIEFNLWREMEYATRNLAQVSQSGQCCALTDSALAVTESIEPRVWIGRASAKRMAEALPANSARLVLASPPTRRPAVWALSYLWGAWVLKRSAARSLIPFLDPQTTDPTWQRHWYFESVTTSLNSITKLLSRDARTVFVFDDSAFETMETLVLAASGAEMELETLLFQPRLGEAPRHEFDSQRGSYRIAFRAPLTEGTSPATPLSGNELKTAIHNAALESGRQILARRGEPLGFSWLHHAAYARAAQDGLIAQAMRADSATAGRFVFQAVQNGLVEGYAHDFDHYEGEEQFLWFRRIPLENAAGQGEPPLIDRVHQAVREILARGEIAYADLEDEIYRRFPGDLTPEAGLIELCARAEADERDGKWIVRVEDMAAERQEAQQVVTQLGERLGYTIAQDRKPFDWMWADEGTAAHGFVWRATAVFADLARIHIAPTRGYLIVPESLVALVTEKARRAPQTVEAFNDAGWYFVRVSSIVKLLDAGVIEKNDIALMAGLVPLIAAERAQLELF